MTNLNVPDSMSLDHAAPRPRKRMTAAEYRASQRAYWANYRKPKGQQKVDAYYAEGVEESSWIRTAALSSRFEEDMSDPWDIVEA